MSGDKILSVSQQKAIEHGDGPLLIIAGAGTGKTTVITERIKHLILTKHVPPENILALTFTEKAAREMEDRVDVVMPYGYSQLWISTFHAFAERVLRDEALHIGLNPSYTLASDTSLIMFLRRHLFSFSLNYFRPLGNPNKFLSALAQHFGRLKDEDISPTEYLEWAQKRSSQETDTDETEKTLELAHAYKTYEELKAKEGIMDFSDLIGHVLTLFRRRKNILKMYQERFEYILVDEFQDTNFAQNVMTDLLAGERKNITVVGDDDQAIYRWRGAALSNIIQFRKKYKNAKIITLTENYRSTKEILDTSYTLIQHNNPDRLEIKEGINKKLISARKTKGEPAVFFLADNGEKEAAQVVEEIKKLTEVYSYKDFAILVRANDHSQPFAKELERAGIPYQFLGPGKLFQQEEVKDIIAYLRVLVNFQDSTCVYRVINHPIFVLSGRDIATLLSSAKKTNSSLFEVMEKVASAEEKDQSFTTQTKETITSIVTMIKNHLDTVAKDSVGQVLYYFLRDTGLLKKMAHVQDENEAKKYQNVTRFFDKLKEFESQNDDASVFAAVDWIDLAMQMGEGPLAQISDFTQNNAVNILTIHTSKGLEFPVVFIVNAVQNRFPTRERKEQIPIPQKLIKEILPEGDYHMQEERRLFYVAMTRAKDKLFITAASYYGDGKRERKLSPFIFESLGRNVVETKLKTEKDRVAFQPSLLEWVEKVEGDASRNPFGPFRDLRAGETPVEKSPTTKAPITYISYSQLQTFAICPLHYKLRYILKVPVPQTASQSFGTSIHASLRDFYQNIEKGEKVSIEDVPSILKKNWIIEGYESREHEEDARKKAEKLIRSYLTKYYDPKKTKETLLSTELPFQFFLRNGKNSIKLGGRIDRIDKIADGKIEIIDYKTGKNVPKEKDLARDMQLNFYALAATEVKDPILGRTPDKIILSLYYIEQDIKVSTSRTKEQLEKAKEEILQRVAEIEGSDFLCSGSIFCHDCEYKMLCHV